MQQQMKKDVKVLMDASRAADGPAAAEMDGLVRFEGAYLSEDKVAIVLEYMNGGSLEDIKRQVRLPSNVTCMRRLRGQ
jgi:serine/threonine protein kinase